MLAADRPARTEEVIVDVEVATADDVDRAVEAARAAFKNPEWRDKTPEQRGALLNKVADLIEEHKDVLFALQAVSLTALDRSPDM